jgi:hypothetical protein
VPGLGDLRALDQLELAPPREHVVFDEIKTIHHGDLNQLASAINAKLAL